MFTRLRAFFGALPLRVKWIAALTMTSLTGIAVIAILVSSVTFSAFDRLLIGRAQASLAEAAARYYAETGGLVGLARALINNPDVPERPSMLIMRAPLAPGLVVTDNAGQVVFADGERARIGQPFDPERLPVSDSQPIVIDGETVGTIWFIGGGAPPLDARDEGYLSAARAAILIGALAAVGTSVLVGLVLSAALLRPVRALTGAVRAMSAGDLAQRVEVQQRDEIGALASAFNTLSDRLAHAESLRRQMTADIAHELRTPLTVISGTLEGLRDGTLKPTPTRFETLYGQAGQLGRLIDDLRTLALADAGELRLARAPVSPAELLRDLGEAFGHVAAARGVLLEVYAPDGLPEVYIDRERITQVCANLISNALRYARACISVDARLEEAGCVAIRVTDDGVGIPSEALPHIFERFYRADDSRDDEGGGTGLGLAIARSIVGAHGGTIAAENAPGAGARLTVRLPAA